MQRHTTPRRLAETIATTSLLVAVACSDGPRADADANTQGGARPVSAAVTVTRASASARDSARDVAPPRASAVASHPNDSGKPRQAVRRIVFGGVDFTGIGHDRGALTAPVVVIEFSDFACPYCGEFARDVYPSIDRDYVRTGKVLFKYIPFVAGSFPHAAQATRAAECTSEQEQFWPMLDHLYASQAEWKRGNAIDAQMLALAGTLPVDAAKFASCYADGHTDVRTARATEVANEVGVRVTPSFLVDGNPVQGALPLAEFRKQIETALLLKAAADHAARTREP